MGDFGAGDFAFSVSPGADSAIARAIQRRLDAAEREGRCTPKPGTEPRMSDGSSYEEFVAEDELLGCPNPPRE